MPAMIEVEIFGDVEGVEAMLNHLESVLSTPGISFFLSSTVVEHLKKRAIDRFREEGDDAVGSWKALAPYTVAVRQDEGYGGEHPINKRTGELERYITSGNSDVLPLAMGATLIYPGQMGRTTDIREKVRTAQHGKKFPKTDPRPVLGMNEADLLHILSELALLIRDTPLGI